MLNDVKLQTLALQREGRVYTADYYVEHGVLHAVLESQIQATSRTTNPYDQTRALLEARILEISGRRRH